jgi:hypothetical protein
MNRKTTIYNFSLIPYITTPNLSEDILSFTRMLVSLNGNMEKKDTLYLPTIKDNEFT